jgi:hypothetical protein
LIVSFYRNAARRWSPYGFRDRVSVPEIVLVGLAERLGIGRRHLPHVMTERDQLAGYIVRAHTGFDADQARRYIREPASNPAASKLLSQNDHSLLI